MTEFNVLSALALASAASYAATQANARPAAAAAHGSTLIRTVTAGTLVARGQSTKADETH